MRALWQWFLREVARFGVVGALAFVVDVGAFNLLRLGPGLGPLTSKSLAVVLATTFAYYANRHWAFAHRSSRREAIGTAGEYLLFFALNGVGLAITLACLGTSYYLLGLTSPLAQNVSANVVGLVLATGFRFWSYRRWVFPEPVDEEVAAPVRHLAEPVRELQRSA